MPCFAILTDGSERKSTFDEKNRLARALYLEQLHLVKKVEARNDIDIILLKKMIHFSHRVLFQKFHQTRLF